MTVEGEHVPEKGRSQLLVLHCYISSEPQSRQQVLGGVEWVLVIIEYPRTCWSSWIRKSRSLLWYFPLSIPIVQGALRELISTPLTVLILKRSLGWVLKSYEEVIYISLLFKCHFIGSLFHSMVSHFKSTVLWGAGIYLKRLICSRLQYTFTLFSH